MNSRQRKTGHYNSYNQLLYPEQTIGKYLGHTITTTKELTTDEYNVLLSLLNHNKARVRWMAACRLGKISDAQAVKPLIQALADKHWMVRLHAAKALGCIYTSACFDPLVATIHDDCIYVRRATMNALRKANLRKDPRVTEALLVELRRSDEYSHQIEVINYLTYTPSTSVIDVLTEMAFHDLDNNIAREILNAFDTIGSHAITVTSKLFEHEDKRAIQYLESILGSVDPTLRERINVFLVEYRRRYPRL